MAKFNLKLRIKPSEKFGEFLFFGSSGQLKNDFFTKNRVKTALRKGVGAIFFHTMKNDEPRINADARRFVDHSICGYLRASAADRIKRDHCSQEIIKSHKFEQAFIKAFGRTMDSSAKPPSILKQIFRRILRWRHRIG